MDENIEIVENAEIAENAEAAEKNGVDETVEMNAEENLPSEKPKESLPEKTEIIGVKFKKEGKTYYFAPNGFTLKKDDKVIVDTSRGMEYGTVAVPNSTVKTADLVMPLREVIRVATEEDSRIHAENLKREVEAYNTCIALIDEHNPKMKLIDVECAFDRSKLLFYFSAEERVDFREIVKSLATTFHTRIEMRQIGIRDEAKMLGGLGVCGRPFCCSAFLTDFVQVSVKMAKEQNISLNAAKISGACGKLMCCLRYEYDTYLAEKALTPKVGARVMTPDGAGEVTESNPLAGIVKVKLDGKTDDADQTVYVREDVVKEEEYSGEKLTKTEIPKRGKVKEEEDVFAAFANVVGGSTAPAEETKKEAAKKDDGKSKAQDRGVQNGDKAVQEKAEAEIKNSDTQEKTESVSGESTPDNNGGRNGGSNRHRRKKHKGHRGQGAEGHGNGGQNGAQNKDGQNRGQGGEGQQNRPQGNGQRQDGQNRRDGAERQNGASQQGGGQNQSAHPQNQNKGQKDGAQNQNRNNGNGQGSHGHGKNRHFRHYNKNRGNGGGQASGGGQ